MKTYICDNCGFLNQIDVYNEETVCSNCKASYEKLRLIENQIAENEIDAIINSVIENLTEEQEEKIINREDSEDGKSLKISEDNPCIKKNTEKCINCGQCKKTCEKYANLKYDLNKCLNPVCIGCGECMKNCPSKAILPKEDYVEVKDVIDKNEKIVAAIIEPNVPYLLADYFNLPFDGIEYKINDALRTLGFDYVFSSGLACDINIIEEVSEFIERLKNKQLLPLITGNNSSLTKYLEVYHPSVVNNISTIKNPLFIQSEIIKENFCNEKGFNKEKIVTVGISSCISNKMKQKESNNNLDYVITVNELIKMFERDETNMNSLVEKEYDEYNDYSSSARLIDLPGGQSEVFIKTLCKLINKTKKSVNEIDESQFMNINGIKEVNIAIGEYQLRIAILNSIYELDYLINSGKYKNYHYIEINLNQDGNLDGNGYSFKDENNKNNIKENIYKSVNKYPFDNKSVKLIYSSGFSKPLSQKSVELLHEQYNNKSNILTNL